MKNETGHSLWAQAAAAARRRGAHASAPDAVVLPPPGFAGRLAAKWAEWRQNETFRLWCRWSLRAAVAGAIIAVIVALIPPPSPPPAPLRVPGVEVPALTPQ